MSTSSKMKKVADMDRSERAARTYQRIVYTKVCELQGAIREAKSHSVPLGIVGELDTEHLIAAIREIGDIEYKSLAESKDYQRPELPDAETVKDVPIIDLDDDDLDL